MREEVHLHVEGDSFRALGAVAKRRGMSRSGLALGLVWEAWQRDVEGITPPAKALREADVEAAVELIMTSAVRLQDPARTSQLVVVGESYAAGVPVTVASSLLPAPGRVLDVVAREP